MIKTETDLCVLNTHYGLNISILPTASIVDNIPPVISGCPNDVQVPLQSGNSAIANWVEPTATDDSGVEPTSSRSHIPGTSFNSGVTPVTYRFFDMAGNQAMCTFNVIVGKLHSVKCDDAIKQNEHRFTHFFVIHCKSYTF